MDSGSASGNGSQGTARWSLRLFGGFELRALPSGEQVLPPGKRERVLLASLALSPKSGRERRKLVTLLWGDDTDAGTLDNLRTCVWNLRKALGDTEHRLISSEGRDIVLDAGAFEVDVLTFRRLAAQLGTTELEAAVALYAGDFLEGLGIESEEFESWRREEATRCKNRALEILARLMARHSEAGETERAIDAGVRLLRLEPLHEAAVRSLMRLYAESGRRGTAVELYRTLAEALKKELGAQPEAETRDLMAEISRGGGERTPAVAAATAAEEPHPFNLARQDNAHSGFAAVANAARPTSPAKVRTRTLGWIAAGGLAAAAAAMFLIYQLSAPAVTTAAQKPIGVEAARAAASSQSGAIAVAVLPFANLSGDPSQDFFSDGITVEITTALAKVPDLRVVARASASKFKGEQKDSRAIGQALGATHLIEGSLREEGGRLRVTAQLIDAKTGAPVWTESYERELPGVFAVQEQIATEIAGKLMAPLGLRPGEQLVSSRSIDPESYRQFLRAKAVLLRGRPGFAEALQMLEPIVAGNPDYAPAWAKLAGGYGYAIAVVRNAAPEERRRAIETYLPKMKAAARRAIQLDPASADANLMQATVHAVSREFAPAEDIYAKVLVLDPNHPDALEFYSSMLLSLGRVKEGLAMKQLLNTLEPLVQFHNVNLATALWLNGQNKAALAINEDFAFRLGANGNLRDLAEMYASMGRFGEAADLMPRLPERLYPPELTAEAARLLRGASAKAAAPQKLPRLGDLGFIYLHIGAPERALEVYEASAKESFHDDPIGLAAIWHPSYAAVRKTGCFKSFVRGIGFVDYWRSRGWPDFCSPLGADDFVCH